MAKGYIVAHLTLINPDRFVSEYASKVAAVVELFGGKFLVKGGKVSYSEEDKADLDVVVEFPDIGAVHTCLSSNSYKEIAAGRTENTTGPFMAVEGV